MAIKWTEITVPTGSRVQLLDVTAQVNQELSRGNIKSGICHLYVPHTTAGVTINENADPDVVTDIINGLEKIVPAAGNYRHAEGNSDAHIKASLMGFSANIPIINGKLALGTWQGIYFCEFDGPRRRRFLIGLSGD
jgi:secondary thiamine-phosphate synthase enzyme